MTPRVLLEDDWLLAVDKPSGLPIHGGGGITGDTLEDWIRRQLGPRATRNGFTASAAHRLDRETSGIVLVAKRRPAMVALTAAFEQRRVHKTYLALALGRIDRDSFEVTTPLAEVLSARPGAIRLSDRTQPATTRFTVRERFPSATLLEAHPETGRRHQLRRHLAELGHPIAGDTTWGNISETYRGRLFLHAASIRFPHPRDGVSTTVDCPLPADLAAALESLRTAP